VTKWATVKLVKPWMSSHFSESKDPSYDCVAKWPECPKKEWQCESCWPHSRESIPEVDKGRGSVIASQILLGRLDVVPIRYCWTLWGNSRPLGDATLKGKEKVWKWMNVSIKCICCWQFCAGFYCRCVTVTLLASEKLVISNYLLYFRAAWFSD